MELYIGFGIKGSHPIYWVIRIDKNLYDLKLSGLKWFDKLKEGLEAIYLSNHKWTHVYGIKKKCYYYSMLMTA